MSKINLETNWRELLFVLITCFVLIISCVIFAKHPSMESFFKGCYILAVSFTATFFFCGGHSLPDEKTWKTFGDTVTVCLGIMLITQIVLTILSVLTFDLITVKQGFLIFISLILLYFLTFAIFVIQICDYKTSKEQQKELA